MRSAWIGLLAGTAVTLAACTLLTDLDGLSEPTSGEDGGSSGSNRTDARATDDDDDFDAGPGDDGSVEPVAPQGCPNAGRSCVPDAPAGWTGPLLVFDGAENAVPRCTPEMNVARVDTHRGFKQPDPHGCTECKCAFGSGVQCTPVLHKRQEGCNSAEVSAQDLGQGCNDIATTGYTIDFKASGGSCPATGGVPMRTPIAWDSKTRACGAPTLLRTGCSDGEVCAPDPPSPFRAKHCVSKSGDVACPDATYSERLLTHGVEDDRTCSGCSCGPPANNCTGLALAYPTSGTCGGQPNQTQLPSDCFTGISSLSIASAVSAAPSCQPTSEATPSGSVAEGAPVTICCRP